MSDRPSLEELTERCQYDLDLSHQSYAGSDLTDLELESCDLQGADFRRARFGGARLTLCNLGGADFRGAKFGDAQLKSCELEGARFDVDALSAIDFVDCGGEPILPDEPMEIWGSRVPARIWLALMQGRTQGLSMPGLRLRSLSDDGDFSGADMTGLILRDAEVERVDLSGAQLTGAQLKGTLFCECDLSGANLDGADLRDVQFEGCTLNNVSLRRLKTDAKTMLGEVESIDWSGEDLRKVLRDGTIYGGTDIDMRGADLRRASFWGTYHRLDLRDARCRSAQLFDLEWADVDLRGADLTGASISGTATGRVCFAGACLAGADFILECPGADFSGADLRQVMINSEPISLRGANLDGADLRRADLCGVDLSDASLRDADLRGATLLEVELSGADLAGARVEGSTGDEALLAALEGAPVRGKAALYVPPPPPPPKGPQGRHVDIVLAAVDSPDVLAQARRAAERWQGGDHQAACRELAGLGIDAAPEHLRALDRLLDEVNRDTWAESYGLDRLAVASCMALARSSVEGYFWCRGAPWSSNAKAQALCFAAFHADRGLLAVGLRQGSTPSRWKALQPWSGSAKRNLERAHRWVRRGVGDRVLIPTR